MSLKRSERNSIIEDYRNGVLNPNYEVIQTKTKGRYTVRRRKVPLTDEQLEQLNQTAEVNEPEPTSMGKPLGEGETRACKRSKKENALFDLQNQLNAQMLYRLNELTNKVIKLKTWKKKMKQEMYESDESSQEPEAVSQEPKPEPEVAQEPTPEPEINPQAYLDQIPQQYVEETEQNEPDINPQMIYGSRAGIDYSKFGF